MKKLMTMLAAVGMAFGLFAEEPAAVTGGAYAKTSIEAGETDPFPTGWVKAADDDSAAATFEETGVADSSEPYTEKSVRYGGFVAGNLSFLQVKNSLTGTPLYYNIGAEATAIEDNVCFDTLVQFTEGCDDDPAVNSDAKIAVWLKTTDAADLEPGVEAETNLYITAGIVENNEIVQHNFLVADSGIEPGSWHRVTIRTIANVLSGTPALPGFLVYIDGNIVSESGDSFQALSLNSTADRFAAKGQLFVSAVGKGATTIQSIGFAGRGYADDISVTWGDQVPTFAFPATDAKIVAAEGLVSFQYKVNDATEYTPVTVGEDDYVFQVMDGDIVYFNEGEGGFVFAQSEEKAYTKGTITAENGFVKSGDGYLFEGGDSPKLTIGVTVTEFAVKVGDMGFASAELALAYLESPEGKTFVGRVNFLKSATALGYTFPAGTTIDVANGGNWLVTVPEGKTVRDTIGAMAEKQIVVNGNLYLTGTILGNGRVETTVTVTNGTCTVGLAGLTVGDVSDGNGAALIIGEAGSLVLETEEEEDVVIAKAKITLGANGRVVVPTAVTVGDVFTTAPEGKKIVDATVTGGVQYSLADLDTVHVTVENVNNGAKITGVKTKDYTENEVVTFTVEPAEGFEDPITVEKDGAALQPDEDGEYTFTVGTEEITITVTATLKKVKAIWDVDGVATTNLVDYNTVPVVPSPAPSKQHYTFTGWLPAVAAITEDTTYVAQWHEDDKFNVTFTTNNLPMEATTTLNVYTGTKLMADGLPTVEGGTWDVDPVGAVITCATNFNYTIAAPAPDPVIDPTKPDEPVTVKAANEQAAKEAVKISVPADVAGDVTEEAYQAYFTKTAVETSEGSGEWNVTAKLSDTVVKAEAETTDVAAQLSDIAAAETATSITIENAKPGLYYSLVEGSTLKDREEGARAKATSAGVTLQATHYEGSGFYQIKVSTTAATAE